MGLACRIFQRVEWSGVEWSGVGKGGVGRSGIWIRDHLEKLKMLLSLRACFATRLTSFVSSLPLAQLHRSCSRTSILCYDQQKCFAKDWSMCKSAELKDAAMVDKLEKIMSKHFDMLKVLHQFSPQSTDPLLLHS